MREYNIIQFRRGRDAHFGAPRKTLLHVRHGHLTKRARGSLSPPSAVARARRAFMQHGHDIPKSIGSNKYNYITAPAGATVTSSCCRRSAADVLLPTFCCRQSTHCFHPKLKKCSFNILMCYKGACYTKFALPQNSR